MANPALMGMKPQNRGNSFNNPFNLLNKFNEFKKNFQGNPRDKVQELLDSGQMTQEQFNQLSQMASNFQGFLK